MSPTFEALVGQRLLDLTGSLDEALGFLCLWLFTNEDGPSRDALPPDIRELCEQLLRDPLTVPWLAEVEERMRDAIAGRP